ncbi:MAG: UvrD-helicase domain-containing protein [Elusimicrobiota bacterium]|jgi:DNA helicase-2/ATP-dependent DNA helicase PcrA|nr:UvrD-helicase domain-containing protein [Elusimicrobiota bacterium]
MTKTFETLNPAQKEAVMHTDGPLIIFAGAGTGKTRVLTYRIAYLLEKSVPPSSILGVTFTNKAANEMKNRIETLAPSVGRGVFISTFHSFGCRLLRAEAKDIGLNPDFTIYGYGDQKNLVKACINELNIDDKKFKPTTLVDKISRAKDSLLLPSEQMDDVLFNVYSLYQSKLEAANALDFGDLIMKTVLAFQNHQQTLEKYRERFRYILIDEYQDTNPAQYMLAKLLAQKHTNICVVGDDDQSVYSWRGADISNILEFKQDYPNAKSIKLEQNYRSTPQILSTAWKVVKNNVQRVEKKLWTDNPDDGSLDVIKAFDENDEANKVAEMISINAASTKDYSGFAVFYRTNAQSRVFEDAFRRSGIPYLIFGTLKFYERAEIKNIMAYLKLISNPNDNISLKRIINVPHRGIGKTTMAALEAEAARQNTSIWRIFSFMEGLGITPKAQRAIKAFAELIEKLIVQKETEDVKSIAQKAIVLSGYLSELELEDTSEARAKIENIQELISAIEDFQRRSPDTSLLGYLTQSALVSDGEDLEGADDKESKNKVVLTTLHLAKGLEFERVFICGLEEQLFPIGEAAFDIKELEEERRLMYVGMTRAQKHLYLCWARERTLYGKRMMRMASRFIHEAGFKDEFFPTTNRFPLRGVQVKYKSENEMSHFALPSPAKDDSPYQIGVWVSHQLFGKGKIIEKSGTGSDLKLVVLFENGQWKKLLAKAANLTTV